MIIWTIVRVMITTPYKTKIGPTVVYFRDWGDTINVIIW